MAYATDKKPGELTALTTLATDDVFVVGDTSDVSEVAKVITKANLITDLGATFEPLKGADDNYVTDAEKSALHAAVTVTDSSEIDFTLTGQEITASIKAGSIDETKLDTSVNASLDLADSASQPGHTHVAANITDITAAARTVLDDTTVDAMVNTLGGTSSTGTGGLVRSGSPALTTPTILSPRLTVSNLSNLGATETIDWNAADIFYGTLDSNVTITHSNEASGRTITIHLAYDGTAQRTITWSDVDRWTDNATGAAPTTPSASGKVLTVTMQYYGTTCVASATGNYAVYA